MLPKLQRPIHVIKLPISGKEIEIQPFVVKQEKSMLTSIDPEKKAEAIKIFKSLVDECVLTKDFNVDDLMLPDFFYLIIFIRLKSTGEMIEGKKLCTECKKETEFQINLEDSIKIKNQENLSSTVKINEQLSLRLVPSMIRNIFEKEGLTVIDIVANSIDRVIFDGKIFKDFEIDELKENILNNLTKMDYDKISDKIEGLAKLYISFEFKCLRCGADNKHETDDISSI